MNKLKKHIRIGHHVSEKFVFSGVNIKTKQRGGLELRLDEKKSVDAEKVEIVPGAKTTLD